MANNDNNQTYTVEDIIAMSIRDLQAISVPADLLDSMGPLIARPLHNLKVLYQKMQEDKMKQPGEPEIELVQANPEDIPEDAEVIEV